ncbi:DNA-binding LacI/PurR family transcriptional regulator [Arthrobacter sp. AG258]|uniref:LacI family DNA-binding transcriptional regulator n=1 Tax=Arthrobacter sp. AG258 TaxID=2183899 RepID=UPI0010D687E7|nr:LacI family DNA-binding transcriptional regulator [Arthrobacter sp. AG258]TDT74648.1 DNA-binding LacI/PurR family transcriptional regulator [Arthrobacter sp. AG258]
MNQPLFDGGASSRAFRAVGMVVQRHPGEGSLDPFYVEFIRGLETVLLEAGINLVVQVRESIEEEIDCYRHWSRTEAVAGVFLVDLQRADARPGVVRELGLTAVVLGNPSLGGGFPAVWTDDGSAMRSAVDYLASLGHQQIAHVGGPERLFHTQERNAAFFDAARVHGMYGRAVHADYTAAGGARETAALLAQPRGNQPTAIIYDNDLMALGGRREALDSGYLVPGDISLLAWDDSLRCQRAGLSVLSRDIAAYGELAAKVLLGGVEGSPDKRLPGEVPHLVVRDTTAPPPLRD